MEYIAHRVNTLEELRELPENFGVEIDLRDSEDGSIHLAHDPFLKGEDFETYLKEYHHGTMILNIKSERIEHKILELLSNYGISRYFFLDSSFPMIRSLVSLGEDRIALRYSEFEGLDTIESMAGKVNWVWIDCFTKLPLEKKTHDRLKDLGFKLCLVSPELQGRDEEIEQYKALLEQRELHLDAICTKHYNVKRWQ
ncbi:hypothetical protein PP178_03485 [Zeaxanthinibacter sp. PT1]|uniref:hypothetical protein n=1 Tax=Zeaxanthinibacter TaxID=561554 RepID=UPI0023495808|nr:hypothetical protein [Zeaxanthinibacter sp. PT1]MDC6350602.1 hypothetical protein [Zeaxanthinibacter sp. PT1]